MIQFDCQWSWKDSKGNDDSASMTSIYIFVLLSLLVASEFVFLLGVVSVPGRLFSLLGVRPGLGLKAEFCQVPRIKKGD